MKKIILALIMLVACMAADAKVIKITFDDGSVKAYTSSQLSAIDFNDDGTITVTTYDGNVLPAIDVTFEEVAIGDEEIVYERYEDTVCFDIDADGLPVNLGYVREIEKINFLYPSQDPWGQSITLSGTILIPQEIINGMANCEGILLFNHYTKFHRDEAPTIANGDVESMFLANPLNPNYIIVESDFYGFGHTVRFPQAFVQGTVNARASLDALLAARRLLTDRGIDYGPLTFNMGYSSGGFDAMNTQKLRDMEYADRVSFDKTFAGGSPNDVRECYRQYIMADTTAYNAVPLLLMVSTKEIQVLDINYSEVFQPYICDRIEELVLSKEFSSWPICDSIGREKRIHEILTPAYCDLNSNECKTMQNIFKTFNLAGEEWIPDTTQRIYLMHSRGDDYVPVQSARPVIRFLRNNGFQPSIIPGKTNFQTNFVVRDRGHLSATLIYFIQSLAAIKAWPVMYTDNELNPVYAAIVNLDLDPVATMRQLDAMGFDCRKVINNMINILVSQSGEESGEGGFDIMSMITIATQALSTAGLTLEEVVEMSEDSGIDIMTLFVNLIQYLNEQPESEISNEGFVAENNGAESNMVEAKRLRLMKAIESLPTTPEQEYEQQLRDWLMHPGEQN